MKGVVISDGFDPNIHDDACPVASVDVDGNEDFPKFKQIRLWHASSPSSDLIVIVVIHVSFCCKFCDKEGGKIKEPMSKLVTAVILIS